MESGTLVPSGQMGSAGREFTFHDPLDRGGAMLALIFGLYTAASSNITFIAIDSGSDINGHADRHELEA